MFSLQAKLPDKKDDNVQRNHYLPAVSQGLEYVRDIVRHGR
jgi:hypothetical protein